MSVEVHITQVHVVEAAEHRTPVQEVLDTLGLEAADVEVLTPSGLPMTDLTHCVGAVGYIRIYKKEKVTHVR